MTRMLHFLFVVMVTLLASCDAAEITTRNQLSISTTNAGATAKALEKFFADDSEKNKNNGFLMVMSDSSAAEEERVSAGAIAAAAGARTGAGTAVVSSATGTGQTVTVTIYNNNGLWQRFQRWWNRLFNQGRRLRQANN
ncbi:hypothetical protein PR003_g1156 [Phytophthora rubi]|uniref:RxLR effector protein n=1 Tax=Phytophthora rubi TaxID=129364 RepID=A0A6A3P1Q3_9STRA|nr:hypothetical protein PR002_g1135 [Phytophthora rubi]KAE9051913.1 hypothetical protein PR001_g1015 [Phytophthora rubi]KAE9358670.1 hypothetical protein PR003_g1156 [Phytophthora rubi]